MTIKRSAAEERRLRSVFATVYAMYRRLGFRAGEPKHPAPMKRLHAVERQVEIPLFRESNRNPRESSSG